MNSAIRRIETQLQQNLETQFSLTLKQDVLAPGLKSFDEKELQLKLKGSRIDSAILVDKVSGRNIELKVTERSQSQLEITLEDLHGMSRLILRPSIDGTRYEATINHPMNRYFLNMN
jgi:hypothetical protein